MTENVSSRRRFLVGSVALAGVAAGSVSATSPKRKKIATGIAKATAGAADNALVPPFEVRVLHKMGFGPARRELKAGAGPTEPEGFIFSNGFETKGGGEGTFGDLGYDDVGYFLSLGSSDDERLFNYVEEQLNPGSIPDELYDAKFDQYRSQFNSIFESRQTSYETRECRDGDTYRRPYRDIRNLSFNRAVFSNKQLYELIVDFWHNHFNVRVNSDRDIETGWASWDRDVIRKNTFGNFANMVVDAGKHPVMLRYLDNYVNSAGGINENYARELFELHTMGAENYGGISRPETFPVLSSNDPSILINAPANPYESIAGFDMAGIASANNGVSRYYYDDDVYEAAAGLTGWRYGQNGNSSPPCDSGLFETDLGAHDEGPKSILSTLSNRIPANSQPEYEGELIIRSAAYHPGTAVYVARKLCRRLISDNPPDSVVATAAQVFYDNRESPDQIRRVLRTILLSDEFKNTWGEKTKRPFEYVVSAMRASGMDHFLREDDSTNVSRDFHRQFDDTGQELFHWPTPDGYPDKRDHWQGSTTLIQTWQAIHWTLLRRSDEPDPVMQVSAYTLQNLPGNPNPRRIAEFWCNWIMGFSPVGGWVGDGSYETAPTQLGSIALQFLMQTDLPNPDNRPHFWPAGQDINRADLLTDDYPYYWRRRIRGMIALILSSPTFIQR